ncbi:MAG: ABC transporter transmembrane domain-containing protein, partial [Bacilli bacterium]
MNKHKDDDTIKGIKFIIHYLKNYWISVTFVLIFIILTSYLQVEAPKMMGESIGKMMQYVMANAMGAPNASELLTTFNDSIFDLLVAFGMLALGMFMYTIIMADVGSKTASRIRTSLFTKIQRLAIKFYDESNDGDILSRFTNDVDNISILFNQAFIQILTSVVLIISMTY